MPGCAVKSCANYDKKCNKKSNDISYHRFPTDPVRNEAWCRVLRRERGEPYFKSNRYLRVCSTHFKTDDFYMSGTRRLLKKTAIPRIKVKALFDVAEEKTTIIKVEIKEEPDVTDNNSKDDLEQVDISDLQSIFDTPRELSLRRKMNKYKLLSLAKSKKIKTLQRQNMILKKKNISLINIIKDLKNKMLISEFTQNQLWE